MLISMGAYYSSGAANPLSQLIADYFSAGEHGGIWTSKPVELGQQRLWQDAARTVAVVNDGDPVFTRDDLSGNGLHQIAESDAGRPAYRTDGTHHWLEYDGVNNRLYVPSVVSLAKSAGGILLVCGVARPTGGDVFRVHQYDSSANRRVFSTNEFTTDSESYRWSVQETASYNDERVAIVAAPSNLEPHVFTGRWKGAGTLSEAAINSGSFAAGTITTPTISEVTQDLNVGGYSSAYSDGRDYGLVIRSEWSQSAQDDAQAYIASISGVTL